MSKNTQDFDAWIRTSFVEMNTTLENAYFEREDRADVEGVGDDIKKTDPTPVPLSLEATRRDGTATDPGVRIAAIGEYRLS